MSGAAVPGTATVVLVHGLWMHGAVMWWMARKLKQQGFETRLFSYRSLLGSPAANAERLAKTLQQVPGKVHVVAHSLGGILLMHLLQQHPGLLSGRVVLLGSPVRGSAVAANIDQIPVLRRLLLGRSTLRGLLGGAPGFANQVELGVIQGNLCFGFGRLFLRDDRPGDGTVLIEETEIANARDTVQLPVTHTSMLFSRQVVNQVTHFLQQGKFSPAALESNLE